MVRPGKESTCQLKFMKISLKSRNIRLKFMPFYLVSNVMLWTFRFVIWQFRILVPKLRFIKRLWPFEALSWSSSIFWHKQSKFLRELWCGDDYFDGKEEGECWSEVRWSRIFRGPKGPQLLVANIRYTHTLFIIFSLVLYCSVCIVVSWTNLNNAR